MSKVLVTGARGLVGTWTVDQLLSNNYNVVGVDLSRPDSEEIPDGMDFIEADVSDLGEASQVITGNDPDTVVHLAAVPHDGVKSDFKTFRNNIMCTYNVLDSASRTEADVIWTSSVEIHGDSSENFEQDAVPFGVDIPINPPNAYALSKQIGENIADFYADTTDISISTIRPAWINEPGNYKTDLVREQVKPEEFPPDHYVNNYYWSYIDARDVASLIHRLIKTEIQDHERFFAVADDTYLDMETSPVLENLININIPDDALSGYSSVYSTEKAKNKLGWSPAHSWREEESSSEIADPIYSDQK